MYEQYETGTQCPSVNAFLLGDKTIAMSIHSVTTDNRGGKESNLIAAKL